MTSINIPTSITTINEGAFSQCFRLPSISTPGNVQKIEHSAFADCQRLTAVELREGLKTNGAHTFDRCYRLESITIPRSVTSTGKDAFANCYSLQATVNEGNAGYDYCKANGIPYKLLNANREVVVEVEPAKPDDGEDDSGNTGVPGDDSSTCFGPHQRVSLHLAHVGHFQR